MRPLPAVLAAVSFALAIGSAAGDARAEDKAAIADVLVVRHGVASGCPGGAALSARIDAIAGRAATAGPSGGADTRITVTFAPRPNGGLTAVLEASGARTGQRDFEDGDVECAALAEAVAVSTALLLDAGWNAGPVAAPPVPPAPPTPPVAPPPVAPPATPRPATVVAPAVTPPPERDAATAQGKPLLSLGADTWAIDAWTAFSTALDTGGFVALGAMGRRRFGPVSAGAGGVIVLPSDVVDDFGDGTVSAWSIGLALEGCLDVRIDRVSTTLSPCATGTLRTVVASGARFDQPETGAQPMLGLGGALVAATRIAGPVSVLVRGGAEGHVVRPGFVVEDLGGADPDQIGEAYEPPVLGVDVGVGVRLEIP